MQKQGQKAEREQGRKQEEDFLDFVQVAMETARHAAETGAQVALGYFSKGLSPEIKEDRSPVTLADREAEAAIVSRILTSFPEHSILGEETGFTQRDPENRWIIDPIDGTKGFIRGGGFWGSLVALEHAGEIVAGAAALPVQGKTYWAGKGLGCFLNGERIFASKVDDLRNATLSLGEMPHLLRTIGPEIFNQLLAEVDSARCYGDPGALMMVLDGLADVWLEAGVKTWDLAPSKILIEEAGGRFSNFAGGNSLDDGNAVISNGLLHNVVLEKIQKVQTRK